MKNTVTEMRNVLEGDNRRLDEAEGRISNMEDKVEENIQSEHQKEKIIIIKKNRLNHLQDIKHNNIHIMGTRRKRDRAKNWKPIQRNND